MIIDIIKFGRKTKIRVFSNSKNLCFYLDFLAEMNRTKSRTNFCENSKIYCLRISRARASKLFFVENFEDYFCWDYFHSIISVNLKEKTSIRKILLKKINLPKSPAFEVPELELAFFVVVCQVQWKHIFVAHLFPPSQCYN